MTEVLVGGFIALVSSLTTLWLSLRSSGKVRRRESVLRAQRQAALVVSRFIHVLDGMMIPDQTDSNLPTHLDRRGNDVFDYRLNIWASSTTEWDSIRSELYVVTTVEIRDSDFAEGQGQHIRTQLDATSGSVAVALARLYDCCSVDAVEKDFQRLERQKKDARKEIDDLTRSLALAEPR